MLYKRTLLNIRKWIIIILTALLFAAFQGAYGFLNLNGVKPLFLLPLGMFFAFFHNEVNSATFGCVCGGLWDLVSGRIFGFSILLMMVLCVITSMLISYYFKLNILNALVIITGGLVFYYIIDFTFRYFIWDTSGSWKVIVYQIMPTILYTVVISPLIYLLCKFYHLKLDNLKQ